MSTQNISRRQRAHLGTIHLNLIHNTNPWVTLAWSWFMPGFGHLLLGQYVLGWILFVWEIVINAQSHFNVAILYTFTGRFHDASEILKHEHVNYWILTYGAVFVFATYHSYKISVETNGLCHLANQENSPIATFSMNELQYNYLAKRNPLVGALWSLFIPGIGAVYTHRVLTAVFEIGWWTIILIKSHVLSSIEYTAYGNFPQAVKVLNPEWTLFLPSMLAFPFYFTYVITVEINKLFDWEQKKYLIQNYQQNKRFPLHLKDGVTKMRFVASFNHSIHLEKAITSLESLGVPHTDIFVAPLDKRNQKQYLLDTAEHSDEKGVLDGIALLAALGCFFGTVYGFILHWGPVIWGLIGFAGGCFLGWVIKRILLLTKRKKKEIVSKTEVILIIDCAEDLARHTEALLWANQAFGLSKIPN